MTEKPLKKYVIIVGGGAGTRMNNTVPKQFMKLEGKPIIMRTIDKFAEAEPGIEIILVLQRHLHDFWEQFCYEHNFSTPHFIQDAGPSRYDSVKSGLELVKEEGLVAVHDGVRPLVHIKTIQTSFKTAEMYGNAVPAIPLNDSIRQIDSTKNISVDRSRYCIVQTPQCFRSDILKKAYLKEFKSSFTDDATVVEASGERIHLIDGTPDNIKITTPMDLVIAQALLE
jgi:2-C-methyl-D-erythritol 4-phosphate cytidylyltransferase